MKKATRVAAVLTAGVIALSGCSRNPSDAAVVDGRRIPEARVDAAHDSYVTAARINPGEARLSVVTVLIQGEIAAILADKDKINVSQAQLDRTVQALNLGPLAQQGAPGKDLAESAARTQIVGSAIGDRFPSQARSIKITLNPRYGTWDPSRVAVSGQSGSLSVPVTKPNA